MNQEVMKTTLTDDIIVINTTAPFDIETMKTLFKHKENKEEVIVRVDYCNSKLKGKKLIIYLSNLNINADLYFSEKLNYEEYEELFNAYLETTALIEIPILICQLGFMLIWHKYHINNKNFIKSSETIENNGDVNEFAKDNKIDYFLTYSPLYKIFDKFITIEYIKKNEDLIKKARTAIDSLHVFSLTLNTKLKEITKPDEVFPVIEDKHYISLNVYYLTKLPHFLLIYLNSDSDLENDFNFQYMKHQFEDYIYSGSNLFGFLGGPLSTISLSIDDFINSVNTSDVNINPITNIGVFNKNSSYYNPDLKERLSDKK